MQKIGVSKTQKENLKPKCLNIATIISVSNGLLWSKNNTLKLYLIDHIEILTGQFFIIWSILQEECFALNFKRIETLI